MSGLMCSYNSVNNVPSCASNWLLRDVARGAWGFSGYVVADCDADSDVFTAHHYERTPEATVRDVLQAGTDLDCGGFVSRYVKSALDMNLLSERDIDERLENQCECQFRVYSTLLTSPVFLVGTLVFLSSTLTLGTSIGCLLSTVHGPSCDANINIWLQSKCACGLATSILPIHSIKSRQKTTSAQKRRRRWPRMASRRALHC